MGRAIVEAAAHQTDIVIKARIVRTGSMPMMHADPPWGDDLRPFADTGDVVVEFTNPASAVATARICAERGTALVSGTTGLSETEEAAFQTAATRIAVLRSPNFSLGMLALRRALEAALRTVPTEWDIEIVERHHRAKQDSPSGSALLLAREAATLRGYSPSALRFGRQGRLGPRPREEIGVHAMRGGTWTGDHEVLLAGAGESVELKHMVQERLAFAHGVLAAVRFVARMAAGLYTLEDVVSTTAG